MTSTAPGFAVRTKDDQASTHGCSKSTAADSLESQEDARNQKYATESRVEAHGNVRNTRFQVVLANVLEVKVTVEASEPAGQGNQHLGQRRVNIHEELSLDVLGSETTKARVECVVSLRREAINCAGSPGLTGLRQRQRWWAARF